MGRGGPIVREIEEETRSHNHGSLLYFRQFPRFGYPQISIPPSDCKCIYKRWIDCHLVTHPVGNVVPLHSPARPTPAQSEAHCDKVSTWPGGV